MRISEHLDWNLVWLEEDVSIKSNMVNSEEEFVIWTMGSVP